MTPQTYWNYQSCSHLILGIPWLKEHNPEVNWVTEEIHMSRCLTCCWTCKEEEKKEKKEKEDHQERFAQC